MAKIVKNNFGNFLVICLIFLIVTGWIFSGWPRIWQKPAIPPEIQEALADSQEFTTTGTWTAPSGVTSVNVECWGGGGGGGYAAAAKANGGGGGGGGAYAKKLAIPVTPSTDYTVTVGAGGASAAAGGNSSFTGDSSINTTANGGSAGQNSGGAGGGGGSGSCTGGCDAAYTGGSGYAGSSTVGGGGGGSGGTGSNGNSATSQTGAAAVEGGGPGGNGGASGSSGSTPASGYGGGGGGSGYRSGGPLTGGSGYQGKCVLTWTPPANNPPTVTNVNLNAGANITLTENTTKAVTATGTVSDANTYSDITSVSCRTYRSGVASGAGCTLDNNNCYQVTGATSSCSGNDCIATCNFFIYFHADPTDAGSYSAETWFAWIKAIDSQNASGTATNTAQNIEMNTLNALDVSQTIGYGTLAPGQTNDPLDKLALATTTGNAAIDANISGTKMCTDYPGCAGNTIATSTQHYATSSVAYASGYTLSGTATPLEFTTGKPTASPSNQAQSTYWGINIPLGTPIGNYTGENTFTAVAD